MPDPFHWWRAPDGRMCVQPTRSIDPLLYPGWEYLGPCEDDETMNPDDMVEWVARALAQAVEREYGERADALNASEQAYYRFLARAAIEAMREPTDAMISAGRAERHEGLGTTPDVYRMMILAALTYRNVE